MPDTRTRPGVRPAQELETNCYSMSELICGRLLYKRVHRLVRAACHWCMGVRRWCAAAGYEQVCAASGYEQVCAARCVPLPWVQGCAPMFCCRGGAGSCLLWLRLQSGIISVSSCNTSPRPAQLTCIVCFVASLP